MPNYCENDLTIGGKVEEIEKFLSYARERKRRAKNSNGRMLRPEMELPPKECVEEDEEELSLLDFNRFISYPEEFSKLDDEAHEFWKTHSRGKLNVKDWPKDGFNQGGYDWCCTNWGVKWNAGEVTIDELETWDGEDIGNRCVHFRTAWAPPKPVIKKMSEMFPELQFELKYFERGMAFNGIFVLKAGVVDQDEQGKYFGNRGG